MFRFSNELQDAKLITGFASRITDNYDDLKELIDNNDEYENCKVIEDTIK